MASSPTVRTRILILSDTHGQSAAAPSTPRSNPFQFPFPEVDVVVHCGDLTRVSNLSEYDISFDLLRNIPASLKLAIGGNHDVTLEESSPYDVCAPVSSQGILTPAASKKAGERRTIYESAKRAGVELLSEGVHEFTLHNGASLRVYATPHTPLNGGWWAFQYESGSHKFHIPPANPAGEPTIDMAITHGPPCGLLDYATSNNHAGCPDLFRAIAVAKPRVHCFGHIHEGWGAKLVRWKSDLDVSSRRTLHWHTAIDHKASRLVESVATLFPEEDTPSYPEDGPNDHQARYETYLQQGYCSVSLPLAPKATSTALLDEAKDVVSSTPPQETLFVNAAVLDRYYDPNYFPWLVELDLPLANQPA